VSLRRPGPYQLQAAIAAAHAEDRPKAEIVALYTALAALDPSPVVELNRAVAVALAGDLEGGLALLDAIEGLDGYHLFHAARADLCRRLERNDAAANSYRRALELTTNDSESRFLERRLAEVS
jgi:RNA polymerase sigma-70 factor (ECF subfamily)